MKDKKAFIFYFLMSIIFLDFGNQLKKISFLNIDIDNFLFSIVHVNNSGGAFGFFQQQSLFLALLGIIVITFLTIYVYKYIKYSDKAVLLSFVLFCAGTSGNIIERIQHGYVIDYIKLNFINFPVFNAFDIMICSGVFLYMLSVLLNKGENIEKNSDK